MDRVMQPARELCWRCRARRLLSTSSASANGKGDLPCSSNTRLNPPAAAGLQADDGLDPEAAHAPVLQSTCGQAASFSGMQTGAVLMDEVQPVGARTRSRLPS